MNHNEQLDMEGDPITWHGDGSRCPEPREVTVYGETKRSYVCGCVPEEWGRDPIRIGDGPIVVVEDGEITEQRAAKIRDALT